MGPVAAALLPIAGLIALGFVLRRSGFLAPAFWPQAERFTYFFAFSALLVASAARADLTDPAVPVLALVLLLAMAGNLVLVLALRPLLRLPGPSFTSLFQGAIRPNTYVAVATIAAFLGEAGAALVAVCLAVVVPSVNVLSAAALALWARGGGVRGRDVVLPILRNPPILASAAGIALSLAGLGLPPVIGPFLDLLGRAALPLGLVVIGAGLDPGAVRRSGAIVGLSAVLKLAVLPLLAAFACKLAGLGGLAATVAILFSAVPAAPNAYVLARQMGGDAPLMATIVSAQLLAAFLTLPAWMVALG